MSRLRLAVALLVATGAAGGCGGEVAREGGSGDVEVVVDSSGGVVRVQNRGEAPRWRLEESTRIHSEELGRISGVISDEEGRVYVADELSNQIHVFDRQGEEVGRIGRPGSGPGEFRRLISIGWLGDTIAALDPGNGRLGLVSPEGDWVGQRPYMAYAGVRLHATGRNELYMPFMRVREETVEPVFVRQLRSGAADTIPDPEDPRETELAVTCMYSGGEQGITRYEIPGRPRYLRVPAPELRVAEVWTADYRIALRSARGEQLRIVERNLDRMDWSDEEWREEEAKFEEFVGRYPDTTCDPARLPRPEAKERIRAIWFDEEPRMWVEWKDSSDAPFLDVFDERGRLLATIASVERADRLPPYVRDDRLYVVAEDELGVQEIRVFEIRSE